MHEQQNSCCEEGAIQLPKDTSVPFRRPNPNHGFNRAATLVQITVREPCSEDDPVLCTEKLVRDVAVLYSTMTLRVSLRFSSKDLIRMTRRLVAWC